MERVFSPEEEIPEPFSAPPAPPPQPLLQPQVVAGGGGGLGFGVSGSPEWCFEEKFMENAPVHGPAAPPPPANPDASALHPNPTTAEETRTRRHDVVVDEEEEEVVEVFPAPAPEPAPAPAVVDDPVAYNAALRRKLEADLAAVAMWMASRAMRQQSSQGNRASQSSASSNLGSQNHIGGAYPGNGILVQQKSGSGQSGGIGPNLVQNVDVCVKQVSSSSRESSPSDDDVEGEAETIGNMNFTAERVKRRKESNRDSARRSRSRKAAHLKDLEEQVSLLRVENFSLMRRLADVNQKYNNTAVDNRVLTAKVETLQTKVKMAEETMKRITGTSNLPQAISTISSLGIPFSGSTSNGAADASVPVENVGQLSYFVAVAAGTGAGGNNGYIPEAAPAFQIQDPAASLSTQPAASLEHLQRRVCGGGGGRPSSSVPAPQWGAALLNPNEFVNMGMQ